MKKYFPIVAAGLLIAGVALAGSIKTWSTGETIKSTDLNANFNHIHSTMVGGHGARLMNSDVATNAAIAHSKLATPALVPKAWAFVAPTCTSGTCTVVQSGGFTISIAYDSTGVYILTMSPLANATYGVQITAQKDAVGVFCSPGALSTTGFTIRCFDDVPQAANVGMFITIWDDN